KVLAWRETLPHRTQPYPPFNTLSFGPVVIREYASASALQSAAGRNSTARVDGVAAAPNGEDDVFAIHADAEERKTFRAIDADGSIEPITNSEQLKLELNAFEDETIDFVGGLDYSGPGDRLFVVEVGTRGTSEPWMLDI